jgi:ribosomal protein L6P/L9E
VTKGWVKELDIVGIGYRVELGVAQRYSRRCCASCFSRSW